MRLAVAWPVDRLWDWALWSCTCFWPVDWETRTLFSSSGSVDRQPMLFLLCLLLSGGRSGDRPLYSVKFLVCVWSFVEPRFLTLPSYINMMQTIFDRICHFDCKTLSFTFAHSLCPYAVVKPLVVRLKPSQKMACPVPLEMVFFDWFSLPSKAPATS